MALGFVGDSLRQLLLATVAAERNGEMIDTSLMRGVLSMLVDSGVDSPAVYVEEFENDFLQHTEDFYTKEAFECLSHSTCPEYLVKVCRQGGVAARHALTARLSTRAASCFAPRGPCGICLARARAPILCVGRGAPTCCRWRSGFRRSVLAFGRT